MCATPLSHCYDGGGSGTCSFISQKRRGIAWASITGLLIRLKDLEANVKQPWTIDHARRMQQRLETLDAVFQSHHHGIVDLTDDEDSLSKEQESSDEHNDLIADFAVSIKHLISTCMASDATACNNAACRLACIRKAVWNLLCNCHANWWFWWWVLSLSVWTTGRLKKELAVVFWNWNWRNLMNSCFLQAPPEKETFKF